MSEEDRPQPRRRLLAVARKSVRGQLIVPIVAILGVSAVLLHLSWGTEAWLISGEFAWAEWFWVDDAETAQTIILAVLELLAGVFAISITVVAIIVQLSATRYTSRVVDLFLADRFNTLVLFAYVVPLVYGFWLANSISPESYARVSMTVFVVLATLSLVVVIPYFNHLFRFLQPSNIINKIESSIEQSLNRTLARPETYARGRREVTNSLQQLSDIALSSVVQSDIALALQSLHSMRATALFYLEIKHRLHPGWFDIGSGHIMGLSEEMRAEIVNNRTWVEMEIFKHYEIAFTSSLRKVRDVSSCVAMNLRRIGTMGAATGADQTLEFVIKGFNTLIMYALSERDIRSAVHVFYQYRILAESVLERADMVEKIAEHFKYYGLNSQRRRIFFIMDAVAYDLRVLIESAFGRFPDTVEPLLRIFLELDQVAQTEAEVAFLKGVRKSQAMLGGFFIRQGEFGLAERVMADMRGEDKEFLRSVKRELYSVTSKEFWEIEDRGVSFYYVAEDQRQSMEDFFAWLLDESPPRELGAAGR